MRKNLRKQPDDVCVCVCVCSDLPRFTTPRFTSKHEAYTQGALRKPNCRSCICPTLVCKRKQAAHL